MEISEKGFYAFAKNPAFYRLYGTLKSLAIQDLRIGYDFTDFVLEDGKVAACLMIKEEDMEYIRVLLKNTE